MNSMNVLKNSFSWKFSKYPRFQKKVKLQKNESWAGEDEAYTFVGVTPNDQSTQQHHGPDCLSPCWQFQSDKQSSDDTIEHSSISLESNGPLYENTLEYINPPPLLLSYESEDDATDHIYDDIDDSSRPANIFLSLVNGEGTTISPDPNIYEVPPGAIFHRESHFEELFPLRNISPPNGFQDKLTWERIHLVGESNDNNESIYSLPIKLSLKGSAIVKSKKKKLRPGIEELLNHITIMKDSTTEEEWKNSKSGQDSTPQQELTKDVSLKSETVSSVSGESDHIGCAISNSSSSNEVIVENIDHVVSSNLTVLDRVDDLSVAPIDSSISEENSPSETVNNKEFTSIIEISGDGTWNTATIPASHVDSSKNCDSAVTTDNSDQDFLSASPDMRAKHVNLAYSGQYYTSNCPVASIKPMKHDADVAIDTKKNIGAQIMEKYNEERRKIIEMKNLPDVSLLDVDESLEEIQKERRKIIESQAVRAKRIDSWIKGRPVTLDENGVPIKFEGEQAEEDPGLAQEPNSINMYLDENGEVVYDSIIQNKSKIKSYWEQLMLAAELASQHTVPKSPPQQHTTPAAPVPTHNEKVHSPDLSETEFYDALSHVSAVQTPDLEKDIEGLKLTETVVERDIRIQQERELALMIERQKALKSAKTSAMKEKEDDLHRSTHQQPDEAYLSIPTTDEGNFSEYGSEDKEDHSPDGSRVTSPVGPAGMTSHHRTQSLDSMSSGHSSGSGTVSHSDLCLTRPERRQTFGPVKPIDEPQEIDILTFVKGNPVSLSKEKPQLTETADVDINNCQPGYEKETPIEREIRLAREREEELRREKRISANLLTSAPQKNEPEKKKEATQKIVRQRVEPATQRVQHEIELATEREKELKGWSPDDLEKDINKKMILKPTTKSKSSPGLVLQNGDINKKSIASPQINQIVVETLKSPIITKTGGASPKIYVQNPQQKGLMKRFLASRGKMGSSPRLNSITSPTSATLPPLKTPATSPSSHLSEPFFSFTSLVQTKDREEPVNLGARPGYKSAEDKIQSELREMKRREEELRQQRRSNLYSARSQPDLLNIVNDSMTEQELSLEVDEPTRLPNTSKLRSALSVQNLLDVDEKPAPRRLPKRKSALIEQWESRIQNKN